VSDWWGIVQPMRTFTLIAMLFASMPAVADPAQGIEVKHVDRRQAARGLDDVADPVQGIEVKHERFDVDERALQNDEKALQRQIYGESSGIGFTFCSAFVRGLTLGVSAILVRELAGQGFPTFDEAREVNPHTAAAGTILGILVLASLVYLSLVQPLSHRRARRAARYRRNFIPTAKQPDAPDDPDGIVGSFVTRDGYEFVVIRDSRKLDDTFN